jgi:hypothetical protein
MSGTLKVRNAVPNVRRGGTKTATLSGLFDVKNESVRRFLLELFLGLKTLSYFWTRIIKMRETVKLK